MECLKVFFGWGISHHKKVLDILGLGILGGNTKASSEVKKITSATGDRVSDAHSMLLPLEFPAWAVGPARARAVGLPSKTWMDSLAIAILGGS